MDEQTALALGYYRAKPLPNGEWLALQRLLYTTGLFVMRDKFGWRTMFCYERAADAEAALAAWDGQGDPPGPWLVQKPQGRDGPGMADVTNAPAPQRPSVQCPITGNPQCKYAWCQDGTCYLRDYCKCPLSQNAPAPQQESGDG